MDYSYIWTVNLILSKTSLRHFVQKIAVSSFIRIPQHYVSKQGVLQHQATDRLDTSVNEIGRSGLMGLLGAAMTFTHSP